RRADGGGIARAAAARGVGCAGLDRAALARRRQSVGSAAAVAVGPAAEVPRSTMARRTLLQSRHLAQRSRTGRWLRRQLYRLGPRGFRSADRGAALGPAPKGRPFRAGGISPLPAQPRPREIARK